MYKWNEMSPVRRIVFVIGWICAIAYLVLAFLELSSSLLIPKAAVYLIFGISLLCMGINQKIRKQAIVYYILAAAWFLLSMLYLFV